MATAAPVSVSGAASGVARRLEVLFTKDATKKRKVYSDGSLLVTLKSGGAAGHQASYSVSLFDSSGKELYKKLLSEEQAKEYQPSREVSLSLYLIQIEREAEILSPRTEEVLEAAEEEERESKPALNTKKFLPKYQPKRALASQGPALCSPPQVQPQIDVALLRVMREHQVNPSRDSEHSSFLVFRSKQRTSS
jgi:hypothetical protein